jgi:CRP/FNR family transcriptional regulator
MQELIKDSCYYCSARYKSIFNELGLEEAKSVDLSKKCMIYKKGQRIFEEGTYPHGLYCVNNGKIKVTQTGPDGKEQIIHLCGNGDVMGYRPILSGDKYSCSATALETSSVCYIPVNVFTDLIKENVRLTSKIIKLFSADLKEAETSITNMAQKSVKERLAQAILLLKETYGYEKDERTINVSITREDLASMVGTAREVITRLLFEFNKEGSIELKGKKIKIRNQEKLIKIANVFN